MQNMYVLNVSHRFVKTFFYKKVRFTGKVGVLMQKLNRKKEFKKLMKENGHLRMFLLKINLDTNGFLRI